MQFILLLKNRNRNQKKSEDQLIEIGFRYFCNKKTFKSPLALITIEAIKIEKRNRNKLRVYLKNIILIGCVLASLVYVASLKIATYNKILGFSAIFIMALNAIFAVFPLYWFKSQNPMRLYVTGMLSRMLCIGLLVFIALQYFSRDILMAYIITSLLAFVVFQIVEIRHFISHQRILFYPHEA